jgi:hypothetical protein
MINANKVLSLTVNETIYRVHDYERIPQKRVSVETGTPSDVDRRTVWRFLATNVNDSECYTITVRAPLLGECNEDAVPRLVTTAASTPSGKPECVFKSGTIAFLRQDTRRPLEVDVRLATEKERRSILANRTPAALESKMTIISKRTHKKKAKAGAKGGPKQKCGSDQDLKTAVKLVIKLIRTTYKGKTEAACEMALRTYPALKFPKSGWRGLYHHVKKTLKARSK